MRDYGDGCACGSGEVAVMVYRVTSEAMMIMLVVK